MLVQSLSSLSRFPKKDLSLLASKATDSIPMDVPKARANCAIIAAKTNGFGEDSPCIFSGSNGHVPPLIEGGRGVELPREIRGNELRVTRAREMRSPFFSSLFFAHGHLLLAPTTSRTTTPAITNKQQRNRKPSCATPGAPVSQKSIARSLGVAIKTKGNKREKKSPRGEIRRSIRRGVTAWFERSLVTQSVRVTRTRCPRSGLEITEN